MALRGIQVQSCGCYPRNVMLNRLKWLVVKNDIEQRTVDLQSAF